MIGAGVIGLELGSVWRRLGAEVTILEALPVFLGACDEAVQKEAWKQFTKVQGLDIRLGVKIGKVAARKGGGRGRVRRRQGRGADARVRPAHGVDRPRAEYRRPGRARRWGSGSTRAASIEVDAQCRTNLPNVWAIGDVVRGPMLAHKAEEEGVMVAERIAGQKPHVDYDTIPWVIYTQPEIAWVGKTEQQARAEGIARTRRASFPSSPTARRAGHTSPWGSSRWWPTPAPTGCWGCTSSARGPPS